MNEHHETEEGMGKHRSGYKKVRKETRNMFLNLMYETSDNVGPQVVCVSFRLLYKFYIGTT
jgi:hypothetical protein